MTYDNNDSVVNYNCDFKNKLHVGHNNLSNAQ